MGIFAKNLGVDPGTAFVRICRVGDGDIFSQPSLAAVDTVSGKIAAIGEEAQKILSDTSGGICPVRPVRGGALAEYDAACEIFRKCISRVSGKTGLKPIVTAPVSGDATDVEIRALRSALTEAGAKKVLFVETPIAAALGAGLNVDSPEAGMIVDIGAGRVEAALVCMGEVVCGKTLRIGSVDFDNDIIDFIRNHYGIKIGEKTAENVKIKIGSVCEEEITEYFTVSGREIALGLPGNAVINSAEVGGALSKSVKSIIDAIRFVLEKTPVELIADISGKGIILTGGGARLKGLCELIKSETGVDASLAKNGETAVVRGCAVAFSR